MERFIFLRLPLPKAAMPPVKLCFLIATGMYMFTTALNFTAYSFFNSAFAAELQNDSLNGNWQLLLPMPGGTKESTISLKIHGDVISGTMSNPGVPTDIQPIYDGIFKDGGFRLSVDIGRITYLLEGTQKENTLFFDMKTTEIIPLDDGHRLSGNTDEISGRYLVPVYSPGGIMENHFELAADNGTIKGQMYVPVTENETSPNKIEGVPPEMKAFPGAPPDGAPTGGGIGATSGGKRDVNTFYDGTYTGNRISLFTQTAQGSLFHFTGTIEGDAIKLTLHVTDRRKGLEALRKE